MRKLRIAVISGGPSSEHEVSLASGRQVMSHLDRKKYVAHSVVLPRRNYQSTILKQRLKKYDVVFLALHGAFGEDGTIQHFLRCGERRIRDRVPHHPRLPWISI